MPYRLYVIEVHPRPESSHGLLYVGSTGKTVEERLEEHENKIRSPWLKKREIWRLRKELVLGVPPQANRADGLRQEVALAERLASLGFDTHCDGKSFEAGGSGTLPANHVMKIGPMLGRLVNDVRSAAPSLSVGGLTDVLMGDGVPPRGIDERHEAFGRFRYLGRRRLTAALPEPS